MRRRAAASALAWLCLVSAAGAGGIDCSKARTPVEKAICADAALLALDTELSNYYLDTMGQSQDPEKIYMSQRAWLKERETCGTDRSCLAMRYEKRLQNLRDYMEALSANDFAATGMMPLRDAGKRCFRFIPDESPLVEVRCEVKEFTSLGKIGDSERFHALYEVTYPVNGRETTRYVPAVVMVNPEFPDKVAFDLLISDAPTQTEVASYKPRLDTTRGDPRLVYTFRTAGGKTDMREYILNRVDDIWIGGRLRP